MNNVKSSLLIILALVGVFSIANAKSKKTQPNIIYILADDMGIGDVQAYNKDGKILTPNIDRMATEGMKFMDAHTNSSVCTPTRYGILTGRYAWRTNVKKGVLGGHSKHMISPDRETVASFLKKQGYKTACIGKWHLGMDWANNAPANTKRITAKYVDPKQPVKNGPLDVGFNYFYGISGSLPMSPHAFMENRTVLGELEFWDNKEKFYENGYIHPKEVGWVDPNFAEDIVLERFAAKTCEYIRENANEPFFIYMPLNSPHSPIAPSKAFKGKSGLSPHADFVMETDWAVGEVLKTLDELKIADNTIIIFTADNGTSPQAGVEAMKKMGHYTSWKYRGVKGTTWEGGHRVPFVLRWPEGVKAETNCNEAICTTDLLATCADLFDKKLADNQGEDSKSFLPALNQESIPGLKDRLIVHHSDEGVFAVRKGKWKLMLDNRGGSKRGKEELNPLKNMSDLLLIDMENDACATTNYALQYPEVVIQMKKELAKIIVNGRSTAGAKQKTDLNGPNLVWPQIDLLREYME